MELRHLHTISKYLVRMLLMLIASSACQAASISNIEALKTWASLIKTLQQKQLSQSELIVAVNSHFNEFAWSSDRQRWQSNDHWSAPLETIADGKGDCEDLSIAKFATLLALGFTEDKMHLQYVYSRTYQAGHMIVSVTLDSGKMLVLDSLEDRLLPFKQRPDLQAVYRFNRQGLWIPRLGQEMRNHRLIPSWEKLLQQDPVLNHSELIGMELARL